MTWKAHILGGAQAGLITIAVTGSDYKESAVIMSAAVLGSVLPDIDSKSKLGRSDALVEILSYITSRFTSHRGITHTVLGAAMLAAVFYGLAMLPRGGAEEGLIAFFSAYAVFIVLHATSSPLKPLAGFLAVAVYALGPTLAAIIADNNIPVYVCSRTAMLCSAGIFAGCLSHMVYDSCTKGGVKWLWPVSRKDFKIMEIKTNTVGEFWFMVVQILILGLMLALWGVRLLSQI